MSKSKENSKHLVEGTTENIMKKSYAAMGEALQAAKAKDSELFAQYKSELADIRAVAKQRIGVTLSDDQCIAYVLNWFIHYMDHQGRKR
jgi:ABC-type Fe3+-hydroxamate transport system substrate-binding protein